MPYRHCPDCGAETRLKRVYEKCISEVALNLPQKYEDYIEFDYWGYVKHQIANKNERNIDLFATLENTTLLYDGDSFVIYTPYSNMIDNIKSSSQKIISAIEQFGLIDSKRKVKSLEVITDEVSSGGDEEEYAACEVCCM